MMGRTNLIWRGPRPREICNLVTWSLGGVRSSTGLSRGPACLLRSLSPLMSMGAGEEHVRNASVQSARHSEDSREDHVHPRRSPEPEKPKMPGWGGLSSALSEALSAMSIHTPTEIQVKINIICMHTWV